MLKNYHFFHCIDVLEVAVGVAFHLARKRKLDENFSTLKFCCIQNSPSNNLFHVSFFF